jgi:molecular chaperone HtpG
VWQKVWEEQSKEDSNRRLLRDADAAVIIGASLLHDIAMHLRPDGFLALISNELVFQPLQWFKDSHEGHRGDRPWNELWEEYVREARRFNDRTLGHIVGPESIRRGWKFQTLPEDMGRWEANHFRVIGEFIRRHHARLAHEIAIYGFPGLGEGQFPAIGGEEGYLLMELADLIGLTARSHGTSLPVCKAYLDHQ